MRNKLVIAIILVLILLVAAVGAMIYLESRPADQNGETTASEENVGSVAADSVETTEETPGITFATENPEEMPPLETLTDGSIIPPVTGEFENTGETESREDNETPMDEVE